MSRDIEETTELQDIADDLTMGNWSTGIEKYQKLFLSPAEFSEQLESLRWHDLENIALCGYYARNKHD